MNDPASDARDWSSDPDDMSGVTDHAIRERLISLHQLSHEALERVNLVMRNLHIRFTEAVLYTGAVTPRELDEAIAWIRHRSRTQQRGIIEALMKQRSDTREIVVWPGKQLQPSRQLLAAHEPSHPRSELLRRLRTVLLLRTAARRGAALFALLSPGPQEGRSLLAAELAICFAQLGKTLLVDADMRRPCQHELFGSSNEAGLAQALAAQGRPNLNGVEGLPTMAVLTSGGLPPNPVELLHGPRFGRMLAEWQHSFEYVLIDTPPTSLYSDGVTVAAAAGNVVMVSRAKGTTFRALKEMRRHLEPIQSRIVGAVINSF